MKTTVKKVTRWSFDNPWKVLTLILIPLVSFLSSEAYSSLKDDISSINQQVSHNCNKNDLAFKEIAKQIDSVDIKIQEIDKKVDTGFVRLYERVAENNRIATKNEKKIDEIVEKIK